MVVFKTLPVSFFFYFPGAQFHLQPFFGSLVHFLVVLPVHMPTGEGVKSKNDCLNMIKHICESNISASLCLIGPVDNVHRIPKYRQPLYALLNSKNKKEF